MPNEVILGIRIQADGSIAVKQIGDVGKSVSVLGEGSRSTFDQLKSHWLAASAAIYGGLKTIQAGWNLAQSAAAVQEQIASLDALSARYGTTATQITNRISQVSGGLIGQAAATEVAAQSLAKNLDPGRIYQLAEAAEVLSNVTGKTAADSFRELSAAVAVGRERAMEGSAGAIDLRDRYGELASMMSEAERRQALFNLVIEKSNQLKREGVGLIDSDADKLERYGNTVEAAKRQAGDFLLQGVIPLSQGLIWGIQAAQQHEAAIKAAALAAGVFAAGHFLAGSAAAAKLAWGIQNAGFVLQYFATVTLGPMLANPITWLVAALGGLAYLWIKLGQSTAEARAALDQYRVSAAALNAEQRAQELAKQKAYIDELTAYIQRQQEVLASGPTWNLFDDAINASNLDKALKWKLAAEERVKMLSGKAPGGAPPQDTGHSERIRRIEELERGYRARKELAEAAESEREKISLNAWYDDQVIALNKLDAPMKARMAAYAAYSAGWEALERDRLVKIAEAELQIWEKHNQDLLALAKVRADVLLDAQERGVNQRMAMEDAYAKASERNESDGIQRRAEGERQLLEIQSLRVLGEITEEANIEQILAVMERFADLQRQITENKRMEAVNLDARRLEIEREITDLTRQQTELLRQQNTSRLQAAIGKIGGGEFGALVTEFGALNQGVEAGVASGNDQYSLDYQAWVALQDQKIMAMEEYGASKQSIDDAYRQYDLQQEQAALQQKIAMTSAGVGVLSGVMQAFYAASGQRNRAFFALYKGFAIAQATIDTYAAFNAALKGPPGPPWSYAIAAATLAMGLAKVSQIASMQPGGSASASGGGGGGGGIPALPSVGGGVGQSSPAASAPAAESKPTTIVNVHVYAQGSIGVDDDSLDNFARKFVGPFSKAVEDGVR